MDAILFVAVVAVVAVVGVALGLALAPRLTRWDERRARVDLGDPVDGEGEDHRD